MDSKQKKQRYECKRFVINKKNFQITLFFHISKINIRDIIEKAIQKKIYIKKTLRLKKNSYFTIKVLNNITNIYFIT